MVRPARTGRATRREQGEAVGVGAGQRRRLRRLAGHTGAIIVAAAVGAVVLGVAGYRAFVPGRRFTEYLYRSLQLFILFVDPNGAPEPAKVPVALDVARFLAPLAAGTAGIRAVLGLFGQRATRAWVRYFVRDHVVVCGLGPLGTRLAVAFREAGHRVVAVEPAGSAGEARGRLATGVVVVLGDASDPALLRKAGVVAARYLILAADDNANANAAVAARQAAAHRRRPLRCFVHIDHPGLAGLFAEAALAAGGGGALQLEFFGVYESVPPMVLDDIPAGGHAVVVGPGRLGQALVMHAARRWAVEPGAAGRRLQVTLVGPGADAAARDLRQRYPRFDDVCELRASDVATDSAAFERGAFVERGGVTGAYVALDDDAAGLQAGLLLSRALPHVRVAVLTSQHSGLASLAGGLDHSAPIDLIDVLERGCRPEIVLNGTIELLARAIHGDYVRAQLAAGHTPATNPSLRDWDDLPETTRESNRAQAADVGPKLAAVGCRIQPWTDWTSDVIAFEPGEVERMAELEHERWCRDREAAGWMAGPVRDDARKVSPHLVAWDQLTEEVRDYDRNAVRALPELLTFAGFEIVRVP